MTKITGLEQKTFQGKPQGFKITFDDGRNGNMEEKQSDKGLRIGDTVIVTEIPYTSKAGNKSTLYGARLSQGTQTISQPQNIPQQAPSNKPLTALASLSTLKANATIKAMEYIVNCFIADKMTYEQIKEKHKELSGYLYDAIDECNG